MKLHCNQIGQQDFILEDFMKDKNIHREKPFLRWLLLLSGILSLVSLTLPFGSYRLKKEYYDISGIRLITGKTIMDGKVVIPPTAPLIVGAIAAAVMIAFLLISFKKMPPRKSGLFVLLCGFTMMIVGISLSLQ